MESQPQNPEFRIDPENFHPCMYLYGFILMLEKQYGSLPAGFKPAYLDLHCLNK